jgi:branched-chain amino acid transport system ATP-binding protein
MLDVDSIRMTFGGVAALDRVSFAVQPGSVLGIIGPNGSGKSTLINVISGFLRPNAGTISYRGLPIPQGAPARIRRLGIARTFQNLRLCEGLTVQQNLLAAYHLLFREANGPMGWLSELLAIPSARSADERIRGECDRQLQRLGLYEERTTVVNSLPYGRKKRLEIARVLVGDPDIILLDEPTAGLSVTEADELVAEIVGSGAERDIPRIVVLIEHHLDVVFRNCETVLVLDAGSIIANGPAAEIRQSDAVRRVYLGEDE